MDISNREQRIKSIVRMEERILHCSRCQALTMCTSKPSLGKGDFEPQALMVFECKSNYNSDTNRIINLREMIKQEFYIANIYHTFAVRCHPKACAKRQNCGFYMPGKLIDRDAVCKFSNQACDGTGIKPSSEHIISCMTYLLEEIDILKPAYVILFGSRVSNYVLKSCGVLEDIHIGQIHRHKEMVLLTTVEEELFNKQESQYLYKKILGN
ncbi:MAG: uracil-DNA glycosylase family protein [Syntrophomonas sp.]|nr:uracil-DNA glycosylase family protein [Syntrophomonas sp.]